MILHLNQHEFINTLTPIDLSIELTAHDNSLKAWGQGNPEIEPVRDDNFVGSVAEGGVVNFKNILFNPHAHLTHTECCGHITKEFYSVNDGLKNFFFNAQLLTFIPVEKNNESVITLDQIRSVDIAPDVEAILIRTLPNGSDKKTFNYTGSNPPFIHADVAMFLIENGINHLLVDLPSVDKEQDDGKLAFHHAFWNVPKNPNTIRTITEFIFVPTEVEDGHYVLELQMSSFKNDACPSRPVLYRREQNQ
ncbi:MAG: cyclase family protein [Crocinitomicaceae bacterium]|jgi:kynurenine formamidase|tara:strand:- start:571 stop:1317 length:747 start_codon:yes stop_codon:yes gene_type:complete